MPSISSDMRALYEAHFELVWRYMAERSVRQAEIDDLVHKVFRVVREHPRRQQMQQSPVVLVCMVARQVLREHLRTETSASKLDDADALTEIFERDAVSELVLGGLESMTDIEREAYLLCDGEGMSTKDVAIAVGVPELAVQRKRARASRQMSEFLSKMRSSGIGHASQLEVEQDLLRSVHVACTPTDRDRDRVFAAMIACSMSTRARHSARESTVPEPSASSASFAKQAAASAPEVMPRVAALSWRPPLGGQGNSRAWLVAALAAVLVAVGLGSVSLGSTHAAGGPSTLHARPRALHAKVDAKPRTGVGAAREAHLPRALAATPQATARVQPAEPKKGASTAVQARGSAREQTPEAERSDGQRARVGEAKLLFAAEHAYLDGNAALALQMVSRHRRSYPSSAYDVERRVLLGRILCSKARYREAQRQMLELEAMDASPAALAALYRVCSGNAGQ